MKNLETIIDIVSSAKKEEITEKGSGWVNMANLGKPMLEAGINITDLGFDRMKPFFQSMEKIFEIHVGRNKTAKVAYVRLIEGQKSINKIEDNTEQNSPEQEMKDKAYTKGNSDIYKNKFLPLESWAYLRDINMFLCKLEKIAQKEPWAFKNGCPSYPQHPILYNYIRYTFCRLQHQNKIVYSIDGDMAAFNTGLTDNRYEPIIALFKRNRPGSISNWVFFDFVIAGEDKGKIIINKFSDDIKSATYTDNPSELIYDISMGAPIVDIDHIVIERIDRLPTDFIIQNVPANFCIQDTSAMSKNEKVVYFNNLRDAMRNDHSTYRNVINRVRDAINLALKRVHWNYKNAVPMFYPKENKMCLLLPLCLVEDSNEDIALVVKRTPANKYEGATILSLDWAYSDARVVTRPNSEWLDASLISGSGDSLL